MATVIKAIGSRFINPDLKGVVPFIYDGLMAAFRPNNQPNGLTDLSGNDYKLIQIGIPTLTDVGAVGDKNNGFKIEGLRPTESMTLAAVYKLNYSADASSDEEKSAIPVGYFQSSGVGAIALFHNEGTARSSAVAKLNTDGSPKLYKNTGISTPSIRSEYVFHVSTFNAETNEIINYVPALNDSKVVQATNVSLEGRPEIPSGESIHLMSGNKSAALFESEVSLAEALVYNRVLTPEDVYLQYEYTKKAMAKLGINI